MAQTILDTLRGGLGPNFAGLTTINGRPALVFSYANSGVVDTQGIDVAFNYYVTSRVVADASYSWFDFKVKSKNAGDRLLPNGPENKVSGGLSYRGDRWNGTVKARWVDGFPWAAGVFVGDVPSYTRGGPGGQLQGFQQLGDRPRRQQPFRQGALRVLRRRPAEPPRARARVVFLVGSYFGHSFGLRTPSRLRSRWLKVKAGPVHSLRFTRLFRSRSRLRKRISSWTVAWGLQVSSRYWGRVM